MSFLNPEGHSRAFDANPGGYGRGEGCGIIILKRLDKAIADGDSIRAVIRATGANSDGWTQGGKFDLICSQYLGKSELTPWNSHNAVL